MLAAVGRSSIDDLFQQIPPRSGSTVPLAIPDGVCEMELVADLARAREPQPQRRRPGLLRRRRCLRPLRAGGRLGTRRTQRVLHLLHALPAGALARRAPGAVRVPVDDLRADRARGLERVALRRGDRPRGGRAHDHRLVAGPECWCRPASTLGPSKRSARPAEEQATSPRRSTASRRWPTTSPPSSCSTRTCSGCSSPRGSGSLRRTRAAPRRSRSSIRSPSGCSPRPANSGPTSPWARGRSSATT